MVLYQPEMHFPELISVVLSDILSIRSLQSAINTILTKSYHKHREEIAGIFNNLGNEVRYIAAKDKVKYHCAAAVCSNHVVALIQESLDLMQECGFDEESALKALAPIMLGNMQHIAERGTVNSLTGPVERADVKTVEKHLNCLDEKQQMIYRLLSEVLISIGEKKNPGRDYGRLKHILGNE